MNLCVLKKRNKGFGPKKCFFSILKKSEKCFHLCIFVRQLGSRQRPAEAVAEALAHEAVDDGVHGAENEGTRFKSCFFKSARAAGERTRDLWLLFYFPIPLPLQTSISILNVVQILFSYVFVFIKYSQQCTMH
jgi:hypothetical protein